MISTEYNIQVHSSFRSPSINEQQKIVNFLFEHLDQKGDSKEDITKALDFAFKRTPSFGGYVVTMKDGHQIIGATVVNKTGMQGYIPENILVYITLHKNYRGLGLRKKLMSEVLKRSYGNIALHVEEKNPKHYTYKKIDQNNNRSQSYGSSKKSRSVVSNKVLGVDMYPYLI